MDVYLGLFIFGILLLVGMAITGGMVLGSYYYFEGRKAKARLRH